jgi:hypothetical protein
MALSKPPHVGDGKREPAVRKVTPYKEPETGRWVSEEHIDPVTGDLVARTFPFADPNFGAANKRYLRMTLLGDFAKLASLKLTADAVLLLIGIQAHSDMKDGICDNIAARGREIGLDEQRARRAAKCLTNAGLITTSQEGAGTKSLIISHWGTSSKKSLTAKEPDEWGY